jgi:hypothetical protein
LWRLTMGALLYGSSSVEIEFDDRTLAHLRAVIGAKLRRGEGFFLSWAEDSSKGTSRNSIWLDSRIALRFRFSSSERIEFNREWLNALARSADLPEGLRFIPEPGPSEGLRPTIDQFF